MIPDDLKELVLYKQHYTSHGSDDPDDYLDLGEVIEEDTDRS